MTMAENRRYNSAARRATNDASRNLSNANDEFRVVVGDTPELFWEQDDTGDFKPHEWSLSGNEVAFFPTDITSSDLTDNFFGGTAVQPFVIQSGSPDDALFISRDGGNVGLGTNEPQARLDVQGYVRVSGSIKSTTTDDLQSQVEELRGQVQSQEDEIRGLQGQVGSLQETLELALARIESSRS